MQYALAKCVVLQACIAGTQNFDHEFANLCGLIGRRAHRSALLNSPAKALDPCRQLLDYRTCAPDLTQPLLSASSRHRFTIRPSSLRGARDRVAKRRPKAERLDVALLDALKVVDDVLAPRQRERAESC